MSQATVRQRRKRCNTALGAKHITRITGGLIRWLTTEPMSSCFLKKNPSELLQFPRAKTLTFSLGFSKPALHWASIKWWGDVEFSQPSHRISPSICQAQPGLRPQANYPEGSPVFHSHASSSKPCSLKHRPVTSPLLWNCESISKNSQMSQPLFRSSYKPPN